MTISHHRILLSVIALPIFLISSSASADAIKDALDGAKVDYSKAQEQAQNRLTAAFDSQLKILSQSGDLDAVEALSGERKAFVSSKALPKVSSMRAAVAIYQDASAVNELALKTAYETAIAEYTKAQHLDDAILTRRLMLERFAPSAEVTGATATSDPILDALQLAKGVFQGNVKKAHAELLGVIEKRANEAADKGDLEGFKRYNTLEAVVLKDIVVPAPFKDTLVQGANAKFLGTAEKEYSKLKAAYMTAISAYTKARKIEQAEAIKVEMGEGGWFENYTGIETAAATRSAFPSIAGSWQESPGVVLTITQSNGQWKAQCSYTRADVGQIRWEMNGTITTDGKISGTLQHTQAPASWQKVQHREGQLSADGSQITGTAKLDNGGSDFTWTKKKP